MTIRMGSDEMNTPGNMSSGVIPFSPVIGERQPLVAILEAERLKRELETAPLLVES